MKASVPLPDLLPHAESRLLQTRADLDQFESTLYASALPPQYWNREIQKCIHFAESRYSKSQRDYYRAWNATQPAHARTAKPEPPPPQPGPDRKPSPRLFIQTINVRVQNGVVSTFINDVGREEWLTSMPVPEETMFWRQIIFDDGVIPAHYADIMRKHGISPEPIPYGLYLKYTRDPFFAVLDQERETKCQHLLAGEPVIVWTLL